MKDACLSDQQLQGSDLNLNAYRLSMPVSHFSAERAETKDSS